MGVNTSERPLIVVYGSYAKIGKRNGYNKLCEIIMVGRKDLRVSYIKKDIVGNLDYFKLEPPLHSSKYAEWVTEKSNYYILNSDFNAIFILQNCDNSTPWFEAEFALENKLEDKTLILLEMSEDNGENSACSLYNKSLLKNKFKNPPIDYFEYEDFISAWRKIIGKFFSKKM